MGMDTALYCNKISKGPEGEPTKLDSTARTTLKRHPERGTFEVERIHAILDEGFVCHVGFTTEHGPAVIPTTYGRVGDTLYLHGSPASRLLRNLKAGLPVCVTVTLIDALVLARSTYHHSMNFRSVVVFGTAAEVRDADEKAVALASFVEHIVPGRGHDARPATEGELRGTLVLALPLTEASAKVRTGPPIDDEADLDLPVWGGILPMAMTFGAPEPDGHTPSDLEAPAYLTGYRRPTSA